MPNRQGITPTGTYKKDAHTQIWVDRRKIATAGLYMESTGDRVKNMADILRFCLDTVCTLVERHGGKVFNTTAEATAFLEDRMELGERGKRNLINNLLTDSNYQGENFTQEERRGGAEIPEFESRYSSEEMQRFKEQAKVGMDDLLQRREQRDNTIQEEERDVFTKLP